MDTPGIEGKLFKELGESGWELITLVPYQDWRYTGIFKRDVTIVEAVIKGTDSWWTRQRRKIGRVILKIKITWLILKEWRKRRRGSQDEIPPGLL